MCRLSRQSWGDFVFIVFGSVDVQIVERTLHIPCRYDLLARLDWSEEDVSTAGYSSDVEC